MSTSSESSPFDPRALIGPALIAVVFVALTAWTWQAWPDVIVDFGREAYLAWQLSSGRVLQRDVVSLAGPLSPYFNAGCFQVFGPSLLVLAMVNLAVFATTLILLYRLLVRMSDRFTATTGCMVAMCIFGFGQLLRIGNYNFITPYAHELTHGLLLSLLGISLVCARGPLRRWRLFLSAMCVGLVFLTKPELFVAAAGAMVVGWGVVLWRDGGQGRRLATTIGLLFGGVLAPPVVASVLLATAMPIGDAVTAALGGWPTVVGTEATSLPFFQRGLGFDRPAERAVAMILTLGGWAVLIGSGALLALKIKDRGASTTATAFLGVVVFAILLVLNLSRHDDPSRGLELTTMVRPLPLILPVAAVLVAMRLWRSGREADDDGRIAGLVMLVLATLLLAKMVLNVRVEHYGFVLAMPATVMLVVLVSSWIPRLVERRGGRAVVVRVAGLTVFGAMVVANLLWMGRMVGAKTVMVGAGADAIRTLPDMRGQVLAPLLRDLGAMVPPGNTLAVLPEGAMINFQIGRENPTRFVDFGPLEVLVFGEDAMIAAFESTSPDFVLLAHKDTSEFGSQFFGRDYAQELFSWLGERYQPIASLGATPFTGSEFGVLLLRRAASG